MRWRYRGICPKLVKEDSCKAFSNNLARWKCLLTFLIRVEPVKIRRLVVE